jgi:hypothetical protein
MFARRVSMDQQEAESQGRPIGSALRMFLFAVAGALVASVILMIIPQRHGPSVLDPNPFSDVPGPIGKYQRFLFHLLDSPYVILPWFLVITFLAVSRRNKPKAWVYGFLAGFSLPSIIFHYLLHWI